MWKFVYWVMAACLALGFPLIHAQEVDVARLQQGAAAGDAYDQLNLGAAYDNGIGVDRDVDKALQWYQRAAEQGLAEAQFNLAHLLVAEELSAVAAAEWMLKAAEQGLSDAQYLMGVIYAEGIGVEMDHTEARQWLKKAVAQGNAQAESFLNELEKAAAP